MKYLFLFLSTFVFAQQTKNIDFTSVTARLQLNTDEKSISGNVNYSFTILNPVDTLKIDAQNMQFSNVKLNHKNISFINSGKLYIPDNALLLRYTDGVTDTENDDGQEFGVEKLKEFLISNISQNKIEALHAKLIQTLTTYKQSKNFTDDITLLSCRFKKRK